MARTIDCEYGEITEALRGSTILVTGGAGFVGSALLYRLLYDPAMYKSIKQVVTIIRGETVESAIAKLPTSLQPFAQAIGTKLNTENLTGQEPKLWVLNGDCRKFDFGLQGDMTGIAQRADIVIHAAGDVRFALSLPEAIGVIVRLIKSVISKQI